MSTEYEQAFSPAFTMGAGDRFHSILCSRPVCFNDKEKDEAILTFFFIRRANGTYTITNVNRTYDARGKCVTRGVQGKKNVPDDEIEHEIQLVRETFAKGFKEATGRKLKWDYLDLSKVADPQEQVKRIQKWGRVAAFVDDGNISLQ